MRAVILANGQPPTAELAHSVIAQADLFLATDGAARFAQQLGLTPDIITGDFDSIPIEDARALFPNAEIVPTPDQDYADSEKALRLLLERGAETITFLGAAGGRMDFTFANALLLKRYSSDAILRFLHDDGDSKITEVRLVGSSETRMSAKPGEALSLVALEEGVVVSLSGVAWNLENAPLPIGTHGVSNVVTDNEVVITAHQGSVLVFRQETEL